MNLKVQCCGIVLITLLTVLYSRRNKLKLISGQVFQGCLYASLFCLFMDIFSLVTIVYREHFSLFWTKFICKTYLVTLVIVALFSVVYVGTSVILQLAGYKKYVTAYVVFAVIVSALIYALPIEIHESKDANLAWTDGASPYMTYVGVLGLIIINLVQLFRHKECLYERQRKTVFAWMMLWIASACIQVLNPQLLVVGFACALGIMVVFFQFENPELNLDWKTGLFNYVAYTRYMQQLYSSNKDFYVIAVLFEDTEWQERSDAYEKARFQTGFDIFLQVKDATVFKIMEDEVLMIFTKEDRAKTVWERCVKWIEQEGMLTRQERSSFYYVEDPRCVSSYGELLKLLQYDRIHKKEAAAGSAHIIDKGVVTRMMYEKMMTQKIAEALDEDRVVVYYQPIYSIEKKCFTSAEALVRIIDRDGKIIPPGEFVQIAENNGMILEIGRRVFEKVCHFFQESKLEKLGIKYIEVNLSVVQCADDRLAEIYIDIMNSIKMNPECINLEITESASMRAKQTLITNMEKMMDRGIHFSLDDFGTGQSNLNYIVDMPVRIVKFDREMIQAYFSSEKARYVMDAAMHMIQGMGLEIVAEGIETEEQYRKMEEIKINYIQGYYFSKPIPEQEFLEFLRRENGHAVKALNG